MQAGSTICPRCHQQVPPGSAYCPTCGEAIDSALVAELQWLYRTLTDLDQRIAAGQGDMTIAALREVYYAQYMAKRTPAGGAYQPGAPAVAPPPGAAAAAPATPQGTPFSWSAFFADQSIAIMAYIGAFLLLIATLIFEIGRWQALGNSVKLAVVVVVYLLFGGLGQWLRRVPRLRTVGGAYLMVFALLTPLVALAVYLFALRGQNISISGVICLSACYATAIYLVLALQTKLSAYSYFAWIALAVAAQALLPWIDAPSAWWAVALAVTALALLAPRRLKWPAYFARPATIAAAAVSALAALGIELQGFVRLPFANAGEPAPAFAASRVSFVVAALALTALAAAWGLTLRDGQGAAPSAATLDLLDGATAALGAQSVVAIAFLAQFTASQMAYVLAALALAEFGVALALRQAQSGRRDLRYGIEWLAVALGAFGALANVGAADPNWPFIVGFIAAGGVAVAAAVVEQQRWWIVAGGVAFSLAFHSIAVGIVNNLFALVRVPFSAAYRMALSELELGFTALLWLLALGGGFTAALRRYAASLYVAALLNAVYVALLLASLSGAANYQTLVLAAFAVGALIAGWRENEPISSGIATGIFGALAVLPLTFGTSNGLVVALVGLLPALVALGLRRLLGRTWAIAPYAVAAWAVSIAGGQLALGPVSTQSWSALGIPFAALFLLVMVVPATIAALWEDQAWMMIFPALLALFAIGMIQDQYARPVLVLALAGGGIALRQRRGRWWDLALLGAATLGALFVVTQDDGLGNSALAPKIVFLVLLAAAGYTAALLARGSVETGIAAALLIFLPMLLESFSTEPTWAYTTALAAESIVMTGLGVGVRARILQVIGAGMVGLAALRGAVLAYQSGVPIALIVAAMAILLLGGALWLSLRGREATSAG
jgi:hypothetical protein